MASAGSKNVVMITLELTLDEATTIRDICTKTGGLPESTRRRHTDQILRALQGVPAVQQVETDYSDMERIMSRGIKFV